MSDEPEDYTTAVSTHIADVPTFTFDRPVCYLTITADGRLELGEGLSPDEATRSAARLLLEHYNAIYAEMREALEHARHVMWEHGFSEDELQPIRVAISKAQ